MDLLRKTDALLSENIDLPIQIIGLQKTLFFLANLMKTTDVLSTSIGLLSKTNDFM